MKSVLIGCPSYGGSIKTGCVESLLKLQAALRKSGVRAEYDFTSYAEITAVRNYYVTRLVESETHTHLLFVDSDMVFEPGSVERLIAADKPVIGCLYATRMVQAEVCAYVSKVTIVPEDGLVEIDSIGMGLTLISRDCLTAMLATGKIGKLTGHPFERDLRGPLLSFFNAEADGSYLSEDYAFCRRWREVGGGEVWGLAREEIGHVGEHTYRRPLDAKVLLPIHAVKAARGDTPR